MRAVRWWTSHVENEDGVVDGATIVPNYTMPTKGLLNVVARCINVLL